jgi:hypothetical protein
METSETQHNLQLVCWMRVFIINEFEDSGGINELPGGFLDLLINDAIRGPGLWDRCHDIAILFTNISESALKENVNVSVRQKGIIEAEVTCDVLEDRMVECISYVGFRSTSNNKTERKLIGGQSSADEG